MTCHWRSGRLNAPNIRFAPCAPLPSPLHPPQGLTSPSVSLTRLPSGPMLQYSLTPPSSTSLAAKGRLARRPCVGSAAVAVHGNVQCKGGRLDAADGGGWPQGRRGGRLAGGSGGGETETSASPLARLQQVLPVPGSRSSVPEQPGSQERCFGSLCLPVRSPTPLSFSATAVITARRPRSLTAAARLAPVGAAGSTRECDRACSICAQALCGGLKVQRECVRKQSARPVGASCKRRHAAPPPRRGVPWGVYAACSC